MSAGWFSYCNHARNSKFEFSVKCSHFIHVYKMSWATGLWWCRFFMNCFIHIHIPHQKDLIIESLLRIHCGFCHKVPANIKHFLVWIELHEIKISEITTYSQLIFQSVVFIVHEFPPAFIEKIPFSHFPSFSLKFKNFLLDLRACSAL